MKILFVLLVIICGATIFKFNDLELSLLNNGFSWTMSKMIPYLILTIGGILIAYSFAKAFKIKSKVLKFSLIILLFATPFALGFILNPIYEGDFSSEGTDLKNSDVRLAKENYDLVVITIPNCPYCLESIGKLKLIKKRNPNAKILFSVCTSDKENLALYRQLINGDFDIDLAKNLEESSKLADFAFPSFVQVKKGVPVYKWSNDQFGAGAMDKFEGEVK
ncbi:hypothetical protein [Fluviicola taffensis]|uniref:Uncharacterized protein n=1 Tax=Fluviicola taffensis (strain DSM 16823 / NCIMB 13979 / RW262) TaxID=755732 RepID=F2IAU1_FLUTR|nr:hypothetical protein [Fluviicola taffensis]AEA44246.1 hypothetical protein Fluta_2260 [Fluviicola taffensis DSM 16823]